MLLKNSSGYDAAATYACGAEAEAKAMRNKILSAPNTEELYNITGTKYYIKKDMDIDAVPKALKAGDAVLFERGGLWRVPCGDKVIVPNGVIFGAYGVGEKPRFYGSAYNYADGSLWEKHSENIWKRCIPGRNVGIIVFDEKYALGVKKWSLDDVNEDYDFYYDGDTEIMYLFYGGNLTDDFDSIEIGQRGDVVTMGSNTVVDNLCIRYGASHGISPESNAHNVTITNCEIGFIGGSMQFDQVRFGNGIEIKLGGQDITVKNNWVYQCYDAGITFQSWNIGKETYYRNVDMSENLVEYCYYGFEYFTTSTHCNSPYSEYKDITISKNIIRFSGYAWSHEQRPDKWMLSHIRGGKWAYMDYCENFRITDNIFDSARAYIIYWWWNREEDNFIHPDSHQGLTVSDNAYYHSLKDDKKCMLYHKDIPILAVNEAELIEAVKLFDSNPAKIVLLP